MLEGLQDLPSVVCVVLIISGASWMLSAIFWHWQRYYVLKLFRSRWWRQAKVRKQEIASHEKFARAIARSDRWRIVTAVTGLLLIALGIVGLTMRP